MSDWLWKPLEYIGEGLVFLGVLGEVLCERKLILRDKEEARDSLEGTSSWILVVGLATAFAALIGTNGYFDRTIADLNLQASQANDHASANEAEAAKQRLRAEEDEKQILQLKHAFMPREIEAKRLIDSMVRFPGTRFDLFTLAEFEPSRTTGLIREALVKANWKGGGTSSSSGGPMPQFSKDGIWIEASPIPEKQWTDDGKLVTNSESEREEKLQHSKFVAEELAKALTDQGVDAHTRPFSSGSGFDAGPDGAIHIFVCERPFPGTKGPPK